jgi:hypothetical protein
MKKIYLLFLSFGFFASLQAQLVIFGDNYGTGVSFSAFGGSNNTLTIDGTEARPGSSGTSSLRVAVPGGGYTGGAMVAAENKNATAFNAISFWVKASKSATLNVTGLGNNAGAPSSFETERTNIPITTAWQRVIIPVPDASKLTSFNGLWHFAEGADEGVYTIWFDDIQYETVAGVAAPSVANMNTQNLNIAIGATVTGQGVTATIPVDAVPVSLAPVGPGFLTYTCNPVGRITFNATGIGTAQEAGAATVTATLAGVAVNGTINVTVSAGPSTPTVAAPAPPGRAPGDVVSIFSDPFTSSATMNVAPWSATQAAVVQVEGNNTFQMQTGGPFTGFQLSNAINLTDMTFMHYDIWIAGTTQVGGVFNTTVSQHGGGHLTGQTVGYVHTNPIPQGQEGKWLSFDIPFADFAPSLASGAKNIVSEIVFTHVNSSAGGSIFVDNIYFYRPGVLPVKLVSFSALIKGNSVALNWQTATETNNRGFGVEKSSDGRNWSEFAFVQATAPNGSGSFYAAEDVAPVQGMNFYRLRQVDLDGKFAYSPVKQVNFNGIQQEVVVYPNPSRGFVNVLANVPGTQVQYSITDLSGKSVQSGVLRTEGSANRLNISGLPAGIYLLQVRDENGPRTTKLLVQ